MDKDTERGSNLVKLLKSASLTDVSKEYLELGLDTFLESGAMKDIPLVSSIAGIIDVTGAVRDQLLADKLIRFMSQLSELPSAERIKMAEKLNADDKFAGRAGATLIEILDRLESKGKPELAANFFAAYSRSKISFEELRRILVSLERLPSFDIEELEAFSRSGIEDSMKMDESLLLTFVNAGLGKNNGGFDGGVILPTELCHLFVKCGFKRSGSGAQKG